MKLDLHGITLAEGALLTLGLAPGAALWSSVGRAESQLCRMFTLGYPARPVRPFSSLTWSKLTPLPNPGALLINLELAIAPTVFEYLGGLEAFCLVGFYQAGGPGLVNSREWCLINLGPGYHHLDIQRVEQFAEALALLTCGRPERVVISLPQERLELAGDLVGVQL